MMVIKGSGGEGKSQIGHVLSRMFGPNAKDGSVGKISENPFARAALEHIHLMIDDDMRLEALEQAAQTPRFSGVTVSHYKTIHDEAQGMQFAAVTFRLPTGGVEIAYRGTDDTRIGWEEDCRSGYAPVIPAQKEAAYYAREGCDSFPRVPVWITGHSKGGNLAVFAGAYLLARQQKRLVTVYNNAGPGFSPRFLAGDG